MAKIENKIKVGFVSHDGSWLGGHNYLINLIRAIRSLPGSNIEPVLIKGDASPDPSLDIPNATVISTPLLDRRSLQWICRQAIKVVSGRDWLLERLLVRNGVEVLSHSGHLGRNSSVTTIGWIPDFQCMHLPEFFTEKERKMRIKGYARLCKKCDRVVVSSETVRKDMRNFLPRYAHKAAVLRFVASVALEEQGIDFSVLQQKYGILGRYFLLPNQFWAHKNHRVVIKALSILKTAGKNIHVYTTGGTGDHRNPDFFKTLINYTDKCDVKDCFHILGIVPFADLASLMRNTVAFINPSKFEGWSTSVEESKSLGKSIILSDIPVHREQAPEWGTYFPPSDAESLANVMSSLWQSYDPDVDSDHQRRAAQRFPMRQMEFAKTFEEIVSEVRPA